MVRLHLHNLNDHISFNLGRGRSRDHLSRVNCQKKNILHINKHLEAKFLGKRLNLEKMFKTSHISQTHALIQVRSLKALMASVSLNLSLLSRPCMKINCGSRETLKFI